MKSQDQIRVSTLVDLSPDLSFRIFTEDVDSWWKQGPRFRAGGDRPSTMSFEPGIGGRLLETYHDEVGGSFVLGRIVTWKPGECLVFEMGGRDFADEEWTEVEVLFVAEGEGTRITLEHRGFEQFAADHPVRHGMEGAAFQSMMSLFWADLLMAHRNRARQERS